ncbi:MAG: protein translocase subunit SecF [Anaerolineae bacterium]
MLDIIGKRYWYFLISALVLIPGVVFLALFGLPLSIDFTGGALLEVEFARAQVGPAQVKEVFAEHGYSDTMVQTSGEGVFLIRTKNIDPATKTAIEADLEERVGDLTELRFESVGPAVGEEVQRRALYAVGLAAIAILFYISWAFRHVPNPVRFGTCTIIALIHDVFVVVGVAAILGRLRGWEMDALFLTALLTVIGFSVHDSIVVFDRIRENVKRRAGEPIESVVNHSIIQTLDRSINTQLTVVFTLTALLLFGGVTIRGFVFTLLIGIISGTYSSIFNASPLLVEWERRPERLLYALSFILPPVGLVIGLYSFLRGGSRALAKGYVLATGLGAASMLALFLLRRVIA